MEEEEVEDEVEEEEKTEAWQVYWSCGHQWFSYCFFDQFYNSRQKNIVAI